MGDLTFYSRYYKLVLSICLQVIIFQWFAASTASFEVIHSAATAVFIFVHIGAEMNFDNYIEKCKYSRVIFRDLWYDITNSGSFLTRDVGKKLL